jgi:hypothetical protein
MEGIRPIAITTGNNNIVFRNVFSRFFATGVFTAPNVMPLSRYQE